VITLPQWSDRPSVVQNLFNPAFCGLLLWEALQGYNDTGMDYSLSYLILPIVLHRGIRHALPSSVRTTLIRWIQTHPEFAILLPKLIGSMAPFTAEGLLWAANADALMFAGDDGRLLSLRKAPLENDIPDDRIFEVSDCVYKARFLGKWFARSGSPTVVFASLGVRP
jgi:hypothetical protein